VVDERRFTRHAPPTRTLERELNEDQVITLREYERYGWELKFVRRTPFKPSVPIIYDRDTRKYAVIEADGSVNEKHGLVIRD
jgi:hypothetical protein